jgi:hypothetical protein
MSLDLHDTRELLAELRFELSFLKDGGYGRSVRTPWQPSIPLRDSPICLNFSRPERPYPCSACHLMRFVPAAQQRDLLPCHNIALNERGETIASLEGHVSQQVLEEKLAAWLESVIRTLEDRETVASAE